jgi:peptide/nickel transport system permease protein
LSVVYIALIARLTRAAVSQALRRTTSRTARDQGLPERRVLVRHALANAAVPIVTVIGIGLAMLIERSGDRERFRHTGSGTAHGGRRAGERLPHHQGVVLLFSVAYVLINLLIDLSYPFFDPRIRY